VDQRQQVEPATGQPGFLAHEWTQRAIEVLERGELLLPTGRMINMKRHLSLLRKNETYAAYLGRLSLREGLIAETLRLAATGLAEMRRSIEVAKERGTPQTYRMVCLDPFVAKSPDSEGGCIRLVGRVWESIGSFLGIDQARLVAKGKLADPRGGQAIGGADRPHEHRARIEKSWCAVCVACTRPHCASVVPRRRRAPLRMRHAATVMSVSDGDAQLALGVSPTNIPMLSTPVKLWLCSSAPPSYRVSWVHSHDVRQREFELRTIILTKHLNNNEHSLPFPLFTPQRRYHDGSRAEKRCLVVVPTVEKSMGLWPRFRRGFTMLTLLG
jgi:hypothetical protein